MELFDGYLISDLSNLASTVQYHMCNENTCKKNGRKCKAGFDDKGVSAQSEIIYEDKELKNGDIVTK
jgi:hypothetical protein